MSSSRAVSRVILRRALREQRRRNRFGDEASCECCGESTLTRLNRVDEHLVCACCLALACGREVLELHHLAGGGEGPTVRVCANCHRDLSELQYDWPADLPANERLHRGSSELRELKARMEGDRA